VAFRPRPPPLFCHPRSLPLHRLRPLPCMTIREHAEPQIFPFRFHPLCATLLHSLSSPRFTGEHHRSTSLFLCWADLKEFAHPPSCSDHLLLELPVSYAPGWLLPYLWLPSRAHRWPPPSVCPRTRHDLEENRTDPYPMCVHTYAAGNVLSELPPLSASPLTTSPSPTLLGEPRATQPVSTCSLESRLASSYTLSSPSPLVSRIWPTKPLATKGETFQCFWFGPASFGPNKQYHLLIFFWIKLIHFQIKFKLLKFIRI
jgi:hypothetical protein